MNFLTATLKLFSGSLPCIILAAFYVLTANDDIRTQERLDHKKCQLFTEHQAFLASPKAGQKFWGEWEGITVDGDGQFAEDGSELDVYGILFTVDGDIPLLFHMFSSDAKDDFKMLAIGVGQILTFKGLAVDGGLSAAPDGDVVVGIFEFSAALNIIPIGGDDGVDGQAVYRSFYADKLLDTCHNEPRTGARLIFTAGATVVCRALKRVVIVGQEERKLSVGFHGVRGIDGGGGEQGMIQFFAVATRRVGICLEHGSVAVDRAVLGGACLLDADASPALVPIEEGRQEQIGSDRCLEAIDGFDDRFQTLSACSARKNRPSLRVEQDAVIVGGIGKGNAVIVVTADIAVAVPCVFVDCRVKLCPDGSQLGNGSVVSLGTAKLLELLDSVHDGYRGPCGLAATLAADAVDGVSPVAVVHEAQAVGAYVARHIVDGCKQVVIYCVLTAVEIRNDLIAKGEVAVLVDKCGDAKNEPDRAVAVVDEAELGGGGTVGHIPLFDVAALFLPCQHAHHEGDGALGIDDRVAHGILKLIADGAAGAHTVQAGQKRGLLLQPVVNKSVKTAVGGFDGIRGDQGIPVLIRKLLLLLDKGGGDFACKSKHLVLGDGYAQGEGDRAALMSAQQEGVLHGGNRLFGFADDVRAGVVFDSYGNARAHVVSEVASGTHIAGGGLDIGGHVKMRMLFLDFGLFVVEDVIGEGVPIDDAILIHAGAAHGAAIGKAHRGEQRQGTRLIGVIGKRNRPIFGHIRNGDENTDGRGDAVGGVVKDGAVEVMTAAVLTGGIHIVDAPVVSAFAVAYIEKTVAVGEGRLAVIDHETRDTVQYLIDRGMIVVIIKEVDP